MKPVLKRTLLYACIAVLVSFCGKPEDSAEETTTETDQRPAILFLGDSLTAGRGLAKSEAAPALIQKKLDEQNYGYRVINAGKSGDTTRGGLSRLSWYLTPEQNVKAVVIGLGSNDAMRGVAIEEIESNLKEIIRQVQKYDPSIQVFLYQMHTFPNMGKEYAGRYEKIFPEVSKEMNIELLPFPLESVAGVPELNQDDQIHPTAEGTEIMAENISKSLLPKLNKLK